MKNILVALLLIVSLKVFSQSDSIPSFVKDSLDTYVNQGLTEWEIPGICRLYYKKWKDRSNERIWCKRLLRRQRKSR